MTYREWSPGAELADRVACFWTSGLHPADHPSSTGRPPAAHALRRTPGKMEVAADASVAEIGGHAEAADSVKRILPDGCMDIIWGPEGVQVAGPDTRAHLAHSPPGTSYIAVRFLPGGAGSVFGAPADAFTDLRLPLDELWDDGVPWDGVPVSVQDLDRFRTVVAALLRASGPVPDRSVPALRLALATDTPVSEVARHLGFSERTLRRRSLAAFGYGPKTLQRVLRFQRALHHAREGADLAWVAHECGYVDQAHLAGEVKQLAGVPVTRLL